jgi:Uncharacterised nucleotidyltransferase
MSSRDLDRGMGLVVRKLRIDQLTAEIAGVLAEHGVATIVLKGPVLAAWLYPGEVRAYVDADLLVAPGEWANAGRLLEQIGFRAHPRWLAATQFSETHAKPLRRGGESVDLHRALPGLDGDPQAIWDSLRMRSQRQLVAGELLSVPDRDAVLLHIALHAANHAGQPRHRVFEDLRRAIATASESHWRRALELARAYQGVPAFATGLRLVPEGQNLLRGLGLCETRSLRYELRGQGGYLAEELGSLLWSNGPVLHKLRTATHELFPQTRYMRHWSALARRGRYGLVAAYLWRPLWAIGQMPGAARTVWRVAHATKRRDRT